jgi:hypothetical protein
MMTLRDEILVKCSPELIASRDDGAIAAAVSVGRTKIVPISREDFAMWCGASGMRASIQDAANTVGHPLRSIALTLLDFLQGGVAQSLDLTKPANIQMLGAWQQANAITADQVAQLNAMTVIPAPVSQPDVSDALAGYVP